MTAQEIQQYAAGVIRAELAASHIPADLIIKSEAGVARERSNVGVITHYALKTGIQL